MIHSIKFTCVLDTNVLYPVIIRDILFWFAYFELYTPKWSMHIFDEWEKVMRSHGIDDGEIKRRIDLANDAFPDALVENYEPLIESLKLNDPKDRHVLAAAIKTNANIIVTNNLKHFPEEYLATFGLSAKDADNIITDTIDLNVNRAVEAFRMLVLNKTKPEVDEFEVLEMFRNNGLNQAADYLHSQI